MTTDPIADMLNRITTAQAVSKETVVLPFSKIKYEIAKILKKEGFLDVAEKKGRKTNRTLELTLKYEDKKPLISSIRRISKPGQRIYSRSKRLGRVRQGYGFSILSTPKGLMTNKEAKKQNLGGEVICEIW